MNLRFAALFTHNAVLQRDLPVPVWGWAASGEPVAVALAGNKVASIAGADGQWRVTLPAMPAGGPHQLVLSGRGRRIVLNNVMIGEVWVCSGQSNMQWDVARSADAGKEIASARHPHIRFFSVARKEEAQAQPDALGSVGWDECRPDSAAGFSAAAFFFGRELQQALNVPVGLINSSMGGTGIETWCSRETLLCEPGFQDVFKTHRDKTSVCKTLYRQWAERNRIPSDPGNGAHGQGWADPRTATDDWGEIMCPGSWQAAGLKFHGAVWFRKELDLPPDWAGNQLFLSLGPCDKSDSTYFNNVPVGGFSYPDRLDAWRFPRVYTVPGNLVRPGRNVIAVRIFSNIDGGGFIGDQPDQMRLSAPGLENAPLIRLSGKWRYKVEHNLGLIQPREPMPPEMIGVAHAVTPSGLYNGMISPLMPYGIRGVIWYQGENNVGRASQYRRLLQGLIRGWRERWRQGEFAFLFVQLPNHGPIKEEPSESHWAELREAQYEALALPNTGVAVTIDIGEEKDIHPKNKQDVGRRLALAALAGVYGRKELVPSGPAYRSAQAEGGAIRLSFDDPGGGLIARDGELKGFAIAGADHLFFWARAKIEGATVLVWHDDIPRPVAVRYAWADNPACNLYNRAGLPAAPFRTEDWPS